MGGACRVEKNRSRMSRGRLVIQIKTVKAARGTFTVLKSRDGKLEFLAAHGGRSRVALGEFFDSAGGVDKLLLTREEGVAGSTDPDPQITPCRAGGVSGPAGAGDVGLFVAGMNISFHGVEKELSKIPTGCRWARVKRGEGTFLRHRLLKRAPIFKTKRVMTASVSDPSFRLG